MKIDVIAQKIKSSQKLVILLNILPMAIFLPLFFIILSGAFDGMLSGFPFFFLIFCCPGFGVSNTVKRKITLLMQERDLILEPYKDVDISNIPYTVPPPQSLPSNPISSSTTATPPLSSDRPLFVEELTANGKFCQNCRNTNPFSARFCLKCGKKL
jgi:ribosomal protein L40E